MRQKFVVTVFLLILAGLVQRPALGESDKVGVFVSATNYTLLQVSAFAKRGFHHGFASAYPGDNVKPFVGDFDPSTDGDDSVGYYSPAEGLFHIAYENEPGQINNIIEYTHPDCTGNDVWPVVLNHDGDAAVEVGLFDPSNHKWCLQGRSSFTWHGDESWSASDDLIPVVGDWDGVNGKEIGLYNPDTEEFALADDIPVTDQEIVAFESCTGETLPLAGDWNNDGDDDVGCFQRDNQRFYRNGQTGYIEFTEGILDNFTEDIEGHPLTYPLAGVWDTAGDLEPTAFAWDEEDNPCDQDMDETLLAAAVTFAETAGGCDCDGGTCAPDGFDHLNSLLVARNGKLIVEEYYNGYGPEHSDNLHSASKSILSALYGVAGTKGCIPNMTNHDDKVVDWLGSITMDSPFGAEYDFDSDIKLSHMITMTSSIPWDEDGSPSDYVGMVTDTDWIGYIEEQGSDDNDLGKYEYSTGLTHIGAEILRRYTSTTLAATVCKSVLGIPIYSDLFDFAQEELFEPLGIALEPNGDGNAPTRWDREPVTNDLPQLKDEEPIYVGGNNMFMRPRDLARFGELYLKDGDIDGAGGAAPIINSDWIADSTSDNVFVGPEKDYGAWWWRECIGTTGAKDCFKPTDNSPTYEAYAAVGFGGQLLYIFPSIDLLVVMTSAVDCNISGGCSNCHIKANQKILRKILDAVDAGCSE